MVFDQSEDSVIDRTGDYSYTHTFTLSLQDGVTAPENDYDLVFHYARGTEFHFTCLNMEVVTE